MDLKTRGLDQTILGCIRRYQNADELPEGLFQDLALRLFSFQYKKNKYYRRFCGVEGKTPKNIHNWKEIPAIPTEGFREFFLTTFPVKKAVRLFRTSGTSGLSIGSGRGAHYFETLKLYDAAILPPFRKYLLPDRLRMDLFFLTASPKELKDSSLSYMMGVVNKRFGISAKDRFYVKQDQILFEKLAHDLSKAKNPIMLLTTAFSLKSFLDYLRENKRTIKLSAGSRLMETGGFKGKVRAVSKKKLYRECKTWLGIPAHFCVSEYGMTELSSQFYDTTLYDFIRGNRQKPLKKGPAWLRSLVINPATGKEVSQGRKGILRHFDLANRGSVMAVQTADEGIRREGGFELLGRAPNASLRGCSLTYESFLKGQ